MAHSLSWLSLAPQMDGEVYGSLCRQTKLWRTEIGAKSEEWVFSICTSKWTLILHSSRSLVYICMCVHACVRPQTVLFSLVHMLFLFRRLVLPFRPLITCNKFEMTNGLFHYLEYFTFLSYFRGIRVYITPVAEVSMCVYSSADFVQAHFAPFVSRNKWTARPRRGWRCARMTAERRSTIPPIANWSRTWVHWPNHVLDGNHQTICSTKSQNQIMRVHSCRYHHE